MTHKRFVKLGDDCTNFDFESDDFVEGRFYHKAATWNNVHVVAKWEVYTHHNEDSVNWKNSWHLSNAEECAARRTYICFHSADKHRELMYVYRFDPNLTREEVVELVGTLTDLLRAAGVQISKNFKGPR